MFFKALNISFLVILIPVHVAGQCLSNLTQLPSYSTKSPISLNTSMTVKANLKHPGFSFNRSTSSMTVKNTGFALEIIPTDEIDKNAFITGGVLCDKKYIFHKILFFINQNRGRCSNTIDGSEYPIEANAMFYDSKYQSFDEASGNPAGVFVVAFPFLLKNVLVDYDDSFLFYLTSLLADGELRTPNSTAEFPANLISRLFQPLMFDATYYAFIGSYFGGHNDAKFSTSIYIIVGKLFVINLQQYRQFRKAENTNGQPLELIAEIFPQGSRPVYEISVK